MNIHTSMPEGVAIDEQAECYRVAYDKILEGKKQIQIGLTQSKEGRALWIEGTLELAVVVANARIKYPDHQAFSRWLSRHRLEHMHPNDCMALKGFSRDLEAARKMLEESKSFSWRGIWEKQPKQGANRALTKTAGSGKGAPSHRSGSSLRKRAAVIPTVMRDDYVPGEITKRAAKNPEPKRRRRSSVPVANAAPPYERPVPILKGLTREQVDPDFKGDAHDFARTYGLVTLHTKQQIEHNKQQEALMAWLGRLSDHERTARVLLAADAVDPAALREWMAKPGKAQKLQAWCSSIQLACESLRKIVDLPAAAAVGR